MRADVTVIGGGIVGLATAWALLDNEGVDHVVLLEKERGLARHQSTHNSGVLHAGLQYKPGSEKARLARDGIRSMTEFCVDHRIPHEICGKLVVATRDEELPLLEEMHARGTANGLVGLRRMGPDEAREIEPHARVAGAVHVPEEGIVSYEAVCAALADEIRGAGGVLRTGAGVRGFRKEAGGWRILTDAGEQRTRVFVNCAGLHSDRVARLAGLRPPARILPFRGEYERLTPASEHLVRHLLYPLPEPGFPFLGVHFTRRIDGGIDAGPNAVLAFAREGYDLRTVNPRDLAEALRFPGLWRFAWRHRRMVGRELAQSFDRARFIRALQRLVPEIDEGDLDADPVVGEPHAGVRAQAVLPSGEFVHDFLWMDAPGAVHVINAPSPAATASLSIGREVARRARALLPARA